MKIRLYTPEDYPMVRGWWKDWKKTPVPEHALSTIGAIVGNEQDICAAWLYSTDSSVSWIHGLISNKSVRDNRPEALRLLIEFLCDVARKNGASGVIGTVSNRHLVSLLHSIGFTGRENTINLGRAL